MSSPANSAFIFLGWKCAQAGRGVSLRASRSLTCSATRHAEAIDSHGPSQTDSSSLDPGLVSVKIEASKPRSRRRVSLTGSRRTRTLARLHPDSLPFEQLPYQCFQEARKILAADREEKLKQITEMRGKISRAQEKPAELLGGDYAKKSKLGGMQKHLEELKILADINDPLVKKRFEDEEGDMNRPIYRYLADKKWRQYNRLLLMERISQFHLVPDLFSHLNPTASVELVFNGTRITPGAFVDSHTSSKPSLLRIQPFDKGDRLVSIAIVDPDVPDEANDTFTTRCHFLAVNIPVSPTNTSIPLRLLDPEKNIIQSWLPPFAQKGAPYHRLPIFVLQQRDGEVLDINTLRKKHAKRDGWRIGSFVEPNGLKAIGVNIFRTKWDEYADGVAARFGLPGANIEFVRKMPDKLPYKKKDGARYR